MNFNSLRKNLNNSINVTNYCFWNIATIFFSSLLLSAYQMHWYFWPGITFYLPYKVVTSLDFDVSMPISSTIITFYNAFIFIEKFYRYDQHMHFIWLSFNLVFTLISVVWLFFFMCINLPVTVSHILCLYVICIEKIGGKTWNIFYRNRSNSKLIAPVGFFACRSTIRYCNIENVPNVTSIATI